MSNELVQNLEVKTEYEQSPAIGKLAEALAAAQGETDNATKGATNPHFRSRYADLAAIRDEVRAPLSKAKVAVTQFPISRGAEVGVRTQLTHASGEWMACTVWCRPEKGGPQALGSVITYLRRYALAGALGIAAEDDDGEAAEGRTRAISGGSGAPPKAQAQTAKPAQSGDKGPAASTDQSPPWADEPDGNDEVEVFKRSTGESLGMRTRCLLVQVDEILRLQKRGGWTDAQLAKTIKHYCPPKTVPDDLSREEADDLIVRMRNAVDAARHSMAAVGETLAPEAP